MLWIGDIHGCNKTLKALLKKLPHKNIGFLGDLVDRGPDSIGVIKTALEYGKVILLGNHEHMMITSVFAGKFNIPVSHDFFRVWGRNGGGYLPCCFNGEYEGNISKETLSLIEALMDKIVPFHISDNSIAFHASASKEVWFKDWIRPLGSEGALLKSIHSDYEIGNERWNNKLTYPSAEIAEENLNSSSLKEDMFKSCSTYDPSLQSIWEARGSALSESIELADLTGKKIIHGHSITKSGNVENHKNVIFVDTGCFLGKGYKLSAYDDETGEVYSQDYIG